MNGSKKIIYGTVIFLAIAIVALGSALLFFKPMGSAHAAQDFRSVGKAAYLIDSATGSVLYKRNENDRLPIASMMKIMTALITLENVKSGAVSLDDDVTVSANAAAMGGSQVFLEEGSVHKLGDLLRTVIVASANDSCVALAEHISGSVSAFVARMNEKARALGMQNTSFKNCTGLPAPESFSSAKDVSIMFSELIKYPEYFENAKVWLEDYKHPDGRITTITNTNKLIRFYNGCDGGKTGFTNEAKFCLAATAKRNDMRIIAVIIGVDGSKERNAAVSAMFDYAFGHYENKILLKAGEPIDRIVSVTGGKKQNVSLTVRDDVSKFMEIGEDSQYELKYELPASVKAPVEAGDEIGLVYLVKNGEVVYKTAVVANESVKRMSFYDALVLIGRRWNTLVNAKGASGFVE